MKEITIYECSDGKRFDKKLDAELYDSVLGTVETIMLPLGDEVKGYNTKTHYRLAVTTALCKLMELCKNVIPSYGDRFEKTDINNVYGSLTGRILSDFSNDFPCLWKAYYRFTCISPVSMKEYEQPYWVKHEDEFLEEAKKYMFL